MRDYRRYNLRWMSGMLMLLLLLTGCSKSSDSDEPGSNGKPVLKIYVFPPDRPIVTRADNGEVAASVAENKINTLHVWVFKHDDGSLVGHISLNGVEFTADTSNEVSMELSDAFADASPKPRVDVYVAANVANTNCGISLSTTTTRTELEAALIGQNYFGVSNLVKTVPSDGLPMSGVMKNKKISGTSPVFRVSEEDDGLANVRLIRAVSKVRFVFSKSKENTEDEVSVNKITLGKIGDTEETTEKVLPTTEYLFLANNYDLSYTEKWHVGSEYENPADLVTDVTTINQSVSPASYSWDGVMSGQQYETLIQNGIDRGELSDVGTFYLRESDKKLKGTINYTIKHKNNEESNKSPGFTMKNDGDFSRNHTWIVYAYFVTSGDLKLNIVEVKDWNEQDDTGWLYNW